MQPYLREPVRLVGHKPIKLPNGTLFVSESKNVFFALLSPALVCKTLTLRA